MAKKPPKTPSYKRASPNNPRNNAGPKIRASSSGPTTVPENRRMQNNLNRTAVNTYRTTNANKAATRAADKAFMTNSDKSHVPAAQKARAGMTRKNAQKKASVGLKRMTSPTNPKVSNRTNAYSSYNERKSNLGKRSPSMLAKAGSGGAARFAGAVARGAGVAGAVTLAAQAGWQLGSTIYNANAARIQDAIGPRQKNYSNVTPTTKKIKRK